MLYSLYTVVLMVISRLLITENTEGLGNAILLFGE